MRHGFASGFVNYKKGRTRIATASDKAYQLLAHGHAHLFHTLISDVLCIKSCSTHLHYTKLYLMYCVKSHIKHLYYTQLYIEYIEYCV